MITNDLLRPFVGIDGLKDIFVQLDHSQLCHVVTHLLADVIKDGATLSIGDGDYSVEPKGGASC